MAETCPQGPSRALQQGTSSTHSSGANPHCPRSRVQTYHRDCTTAEHTTEKTKSTQHNQGPASNIANIASSGANYRDCTTWQLVASYFAKNCSFLLHQITSQKCRKNGNANYTKSPPVLSAVHHQYQCVYFQFQLQQVCIDPVWLPTGQCPAHMLVLNHGTWGWSVVLTHIGWLPNPHVRF